MSGLERFLFQPPSSPSGRGLSLLPINKHPLPQATGGQPGTMRAPPPSLAQKNTKYTSGQHRGSYVGPANTFPPKNNTEYTPGQHLGSYVWAPRALSLAKTMQSVRGAHSYDPIRCPEVYFVLFFRGKVLAWPTHMTQYVAPKCILYCFFTRESARMAHKYDPICCSEVYFV